MEITGSYLDGFAEQEFVVQINLNGFWESHLVWAYDRESALSSPFIADLLIDSDYAPLVRPALYKEWDNDKSEWLNDGRFVCNCNTRQNGKEKN